jgi:hypothetical protein
MTVKFGLPGAGRRFPWSTSIANLRRLELLVQHGCHVDTLRKALTRNSDGSASGPLAGALDLLVEER